MAYIESHQSLSRHRKTLAAVSALRVDRHKLLGHLHELWWWGLDNADISGLVGHVSHEVIAEAAGWQIKDADRFVETLLSVGFMDATADGLVLHDWPDYAGKLNERREQNRERMRRARAQRKPDPDPPVERARAAHVQRTNGAQAAHVSSTFDARAPATGAKLNKAQLNEPELPPAATQQPPTGAKEAVPKPRRERTPITDEDVEHLVGKYAERYGNRQAVRDEIDLALNHNARFKAISERLYVDGWLRKELQHRPGWRVIGGRAGEQVPIRPPVDRTGVAN